MGRPRQFDEATAVHAAVRVFQERGFASTSIDHLVDATGVHRGSLYGVFGSKHGLLLRALDAVDSGDDADQRLDLVLVGTLELAPGDARIRERLARIIDDHHITAHELGARLLARATLHSEGNIA